MKKDNDYAELEQLFGNKEQDKELVNKVEYLKQIFNGLISNETKSQVEQTEEIEKAIQSCFGIFEDDNFKPEQYAQGIKNYLGFSLLEDLWEEFKQRFCAFLNFKLNRKTTIKKIISDIPTFSDSFFNFYTISEEKKLAYKGAIWMACKSIERFDFHFCK